MLMICSWDGIVDFSFFGGEYHIQNILRSLFSLIFLFDLITTTNRRCGWDGCWQWWTVNLLICFFVLVGDKLLALYTRNCCCCYYYSFQVVVVVVSRCLVRPSVRPSRLLPIYFERFWVNKKITNILFSFGGFFFVVGEFLIFVICVSALF